jgi:hypothetical protein
VRFAEIEEAGLLLLALEKNKGDLDRESLL